MSFSLLVPVVTAALFNPNPVSANTSYLLQVTVTEQTIIIEQAVRYCGTFACGGEDI